MSNERLRDGMQLNDRQEWMNKLVLLFYGKSEEMCSNMRLQGNSWPHI
jgi:hypothetical protein